MRALGRWFPAAAVVAVVAVAHPAGGQVIGWTATLAPEATGATGSGFGVVTLDLSTNVMRIRATWTGLSGTTTVSHIHCCTALPGTGTAGVAITPGTLPGFPVGLHAGSYDSFSQIDLDLASSFTAGFLNNFAGGSLANADATIIANANAGRAYLNIHTSAFPGGEIRGFLVETPEPSTYVLMATGLAAVAAAGWRRRRA
jgi:hypothetical protein